MKDFTSEISYKTAKSRGPGGQNVNKVETMVTAKWNVGESYFFTNEEKNLIYEKLKNKINAEGFLLVTSQESRSQLDNKGKATEKILEIVEKSLVIPNFRYVTKPTRASKEKRLDQKKQNSQKKDNRKFKP